MSSNADVPTVAQPASPRQWISVVGVYLFIPLVLLVCGGDFGWWQALGLFPADCCRRPRGAHLGGTAASGVAGRTTKYGECPKCESLGQSTCAIDGAECEFSTGHCAGLDHRFGWSPVFPLWLIVLGFLLISLGYAFAAWALIENRFFSSVVRIQVDRGHVVCDSGPYRVVRHPGYAGNMLALLGIVLALNSMWTLIPATVALIIAVIRTVLEDQTLQDELPGYRDYARRVRYRLIPWIY